MSKHSTALPRIRVGVVLVDGDRLLLVRHQKKDATYWLLPGGGLDYGETIEECAKREILEETGLEIEVKKFLYLSEGIAPDKSRHIVQLFVLGERTGGNLIACDEEVIAEVAWIPFSELKTITLYPTIAETLLASQQEGFKGEMRYLGALWS
jgi:8-oxo-dGTP diphosphatase